jgi:hypothetical protein
VADAPEEVTCVALDSEAVDELLPCGLVGWAVVVSGSGTFEFPGAAEEGALEGDIPVEFCNPDEEVDCPESVADAPEEVTCVALEMEAVDELLLCGPVGCAVVVPDGSGTFEFPGTAEEGALEGGIPVEFWNPDEEAVILLPDEEELTEDGAAVTFPDGTVEDGAAVRFPDVTVEEAADAALVRLPAIPVAVGADELVELLAVIVGTLLEEFEDDGVPETLAVELGSNWSVIASIIPIYPSCSTYLELEGPVLFAGDVVFAAHSPGRIM